MYEALIWARLGSQLAAAKLASGSRRVAARLSDPSGQDLVEYGGILILVAAIIAAMFQLGIVHDVSQFVGSAISHIIGSDASNAANGSTTKGS